MKTSGLKEIRDAVADRRLYGRTFFARCIPLLSLGLGLQFYLTFLLNRQMLVVYVPSVIVFILFSAVRAKNLKREFYCIGYLLGFLFLVASVFAETATFVFQYSNPPAYGAVQLLTVFCISVVALLVSTLHITVWGQRVSLRKNVRLTDDFFKKQKEEWKKKLRGFPNSKNIIDSLDGGEFVANLFDRGSFDLAVLWSCNVIEKVIGAVEEGVVSKDPAKKELFRQPNGQRRSPPAQLANLGYSPPHKDTTEEELDLETLWHDVRVGIAHFNRKPSFRQTYGTLKVLVSFTQDMPGVLQIGNN